MFKGKMYYPMYPRDSEVRNFVKSFLFFYLFTCPKLSNFMSMKNNEKLNTLTLFRPRWNFRSMNFIQNLSLTMNETPAINNKYIALVL